MNADVMILLVGEQPAPNLLPLRHYHPTRVVLVHTRLPVSQTRANRLAAVVAAGVERPFCETEAYPVDSIRRTLEFYIAERCWAGRQLIFNLTGGTKTMALAAYETARQMNARAFYYQTEDNKSLIHPYHFEQGNLICEPVVPIKETLTLDHYLRLYIGEYKVGALKEPLEKMVEATLHEFLPEYELMTSVRLVELSGNVEIDLLVRRGNQVAVFETKRQGKKGIDQLNGVTDQRTLGTYTRKILVSATQLDPNNLDLAQAYNIKVVVLPSAQSGTLTEPDKQALVEAVRDTLEPKKK